MRSQSRQIKSQNKLYFCKLCAFTTTDQEELDLHYELSHNDPDDDVSYELEIAWQQKRHEKKPKTLKEKALKQLKLLVEGKTFRDEYLGSCEQRYYIGRIGNAITLLPYATLC